MSGGVSTIARAMMGLIEALSVSKFKRVLNPKGLRWHIRTSLKQASYTPGVTTDKQNYDPVAYSKTISIIHHILLFTLEDL